MKNANDDREVGRLDELVGRAEFGDLWLPQDAIARLRQLQHSGTATRCELIALVALIPEWFLDPQAAMRAAEDGGITVIEFEGLLRPPNTGSSTK